MAPEPALLEHILLILKDAGARAFSCDAFSVEFAAETPIDITPPKPVPPAQRGQIVHKAEGGIVPLVDSQVSAYSKAFGGQLPTFSREAS